MEDLTKSKTMTHLENSGLLKPLAEKPLATAIFCQIYHWLRQTHGKWAFYKQRDKVAERRENLELQLYLKSDAKAPDDLKVLKGFPLKLSPELISCFVKEVVAPLLINSRWVLKSTDIFLNQEVSPFLFGRARIRFTVPNPRPPKLSIFVSNF